MTYKVTGVTRNNSGVPLGSCECFLLKHDGTAHTLIQTGAMVTSNSSTGAYGFTGLTDNASAYSVAMFKSGSPNVMDVTDRNLTPVVETGVNDPYTTAWASVVATRGTAPSSTVKGHVDTLVTSLKSSFGTTLESVFVRIWLLANFDNNEHASFTSLINPSSTEAAKSGTFASTTLGYQSDGTTGFINTNFTPSTDGGTIYTTTGASFGFYDLTNNSTPSSPNHIQMGADDNVSKSDSIIGIWNSNNHGLGAIGSYNVCLADTASEGNTRGLHIVTRESSTNCRYDKFDPTGTTAWPGVSTNVGAANLTPLPVYLCAQNLGGTATGFAAEKLAFAFTGKTMSTTDTAALSAAVKAYMTSLGIAVY